MLDQTCTHANMLAVFPPDYSQGQALVEPLALPGFTRCIHKFLCKTTQKRASGLAIHTSGLNCHWLKVV